MDSQREPPQGFRGRNPREGAAAGGAGRRGTARAGPSGLREAPGGGGRDGAGRAIRDPPCGRGGSTEAGRLPRTEHLATARRSGVAMETRGETHGAPRLTGRGRAG